ncbi:aa3-type cytochrome c oxidase subunit IV [Pelagibacterales bacterium SAG-MED15]|nr:aa3-type cytochrome c oxidase subunit IV [Pelagibacterales bacterium SAG-MED15]
MNNGEHKETWNKFTKFVLWGSIAIITILVLMAILLL